MTVAFFFFQAEDGIRDGRVTGVQTCALPICFPSCPVGETGFRGAPGMVPSGGCGTRRRCGRDTRGGAPAQKVPAASGDHVRSEERRVGKEWRFRWSPEPLKKKRGRGLGWV